MILDKTTKIKWSKNNKKRYINKGYTFTKLGEEFEVEIEDLTKGNSNRINIQCDNCGRTFKRCWNTYNASSSVKKYNKWFCLQCVAKLFRGKSYHNKMIENGNDFEQWCIENDRQDILDRWDYELNKCSPNEITPHTNNKYYFKCPKGLHKSECKRISDYTNGNIGVMNCKGCNSFAQWGINNLGEDFLEKYWDYKKNIGIDPWKIAYGNHRKIYIKCQEKDYHGSYKTSCNIFTVGNRCPYCRGLKVHKFDSLGTIYPESLKYWSNKNKKSPYEYSPFSMKTVLWKCPNGLHNNYFRSIAATVVYQFRCPSCQFSKGEKRIENWLINNNYNKISKEKYYKISDAEKKSKKYYIPQITFDRLFGIHNGLLSYDFYLPMYNLLIEYQGEYHDGHINGNYQSKKDFEKQQEHDKRKKRYAKDNNIKLLEIWYWDYDNIESILEEKIKESEK